MASPTSHPSSSPPALPSLAQGAKEKDPRRDKLLAARDAWYAAFYGGEHLTPGFRH